MAWETNNVITDPAKDQILADTGLLVNHRCTVEVLCWANIGMEMVVELVGADGTVKSSQVLPVTLSWLRLPFVTRFRFETNERVRVRARDAVVGTCQASILHT